MSDIRESRLAAKVKAVNAANAYAVTLYDALTDIFRPLVGQVILKNGGDLLAKVAKLLPEFPHGNSLMVYKLSSAYSLAWVVKTSENVDGDCTCLYHETTVYVGNVSGHTLTELCKPLSLRSDYTVDEIRAARQRHNEAKRIADEARSALYPFGETDR